VSRKEASWRCKSPERDRRSWGSLGRKRVNSHTYGTLKECIDGETEVVVVVVFFRESRSKKKHTLTPYRKLKKSIARNDSCFASVGQSHRGWKGTDFQIVNCDSLVVIVVSTRASFAAHRGPLLAEFERVGRCHGGVSIPGIYDGWNIPWLVELAWKTSKRQDKAIELGIDRYLS